jgi:rhamnopyranosyl-N-acetylglucosaminyl-diphospho-decaprenol beta-1,3/1,4-galactofuranosyltransferase
MPEQVCAVVVTYNRHALLRECLHALLSQTRSVEQILVVNNASTDDTARMLDDEFSQVSVLHLPDNAGGAGGFHAGMQWAHAQGYAWIWAMDDDGRPAPDCLANLLQHRNTAQVLIPLEQDSAGLRSSAGVWHGRVTDVPIADRTHPLPPGHYLFALVGPLFHREVLDRAGLPIKEYFIWYDDVEYALRLQRLGILSQVVPDAIMHHTFGVKREVRFLWQRKIRAYHAPWKVYYGARNAFYTITRFQPDVRSLHCLLSDQARWFIGDLLYEPERWTYARMRLGGLWDGVWGRLGKRV